MMKIFDKYDGYFITIEGNEGSGKTTQAKLLAEYLTNNYNHEVILTKEPGEKDIEECRKLREILLNPKYKLNYKSELLLMLADRSQHVEKMIMPALKRGAVVISDRFYDSTMVYQGIARGLFGKNLEYYTIIKDMNNYVCNNLIPDVTIITLIDPKIGLSRSSHKSEFGSKDTFEKENIDFHNKVYNGFQYIYDHEKHIRNIEKVDVIYGIYETHEDIIKIVRRLVEKCTKSLD